MIHCIAVDDEPLALTVIRKYCENAPGIQLAGSFTDAILALNFLKDHPVDLLFLDIQMPDINGFQFLQRLEIPPLVIFTTAYSQYAVKGFEMEAVDYLVKPIKFERFTQSVEKAQKWLNLQLSENLKNEPDHLIVKSGYSLVSIKFDDISFIEGQDDYIKIILSDGKKPVMSLMSLKAVLEKLPHERFIRVHRSFIVSVSKIKSIRKKIIHLETGVIPVGEAYSEGLNTWLTE